VTAVDWSRWRKCPVCAAKARQPCLKITGRLSDGTDVWLLADRPHSGRKPRTGGAS
jgi:hypothetical protein